MPRIGRCGLSERVRETSIQVSRQFPFKGICIDTPLLENRFAGFLGGHDFFSLTIRRADSAIE